MDQSHAYAVASSQRAAQYFVPTFLVCLHKNIDGIRTEKMKSILNASVLAAAVFMAGCEFTNNEPQSSGLEGSFQLLSDSSKVIWKFSNGADFFEQVTYSCDTAEIRSKFNLTDTILTLTSGQFRAPTTSGCPAIISDWETLPHLEYKVKLNAEGNLLVLGCKVGRCPESSAVWIEYIRQK